MENKYELTFPQKNILLVDEVYKDSKVNLITGIININKGFNTKFCNEAINNIIKNNDAMRINIIHNLKKTLKSFYLQVAPSSSISLFISSYPVSISTLFPNN